MPSMRHVYIAFYLSLVIRFLRTTIRKMLVPHRKFRNKYKFGLYAVPKDELADSYLELKERGLTAPVKVNLNF